jgi:sec-independent protein translocase protein TatB
MFGIGFWEMIVIGGLVLVAVGPDRLPTMLKQAARFYRQFRRTAEDVRASTGIDQMLRDEELKELAELRKQRLELMGPSGAKPGAKPAAPAGSVVKPAPAAAPPADAGPIAGQGESVPAKKAALGPASAPLVRGLGLEAREREVPSVGVDLSEARLREPPPKPQQDVPPEHVHPSKAALFAKTKAEA